MTGWHRFVGLGGLVGWPSQGSFWLILKLLSPLLPHFVPLLPRFGPLLAQLRPLLARPGRLLAYLGLSCLILDLPCLILDLPCLILGFPCLISGLPCLILGLPWRLSWLILGLSRLLWTVPWPISGLIRPILKGRLFFWGGGVSCQNLNSVWDVLRIWPSCISFFYGFGRPLLAFAETAPL